MPLYAAAFFLPTSVAIPYLLEDIYLRGGYRSVVDLEALNAIKPGTRKLGMMVYVQSEKKLYWNPKVLAGPAAFEVFDATEYVNFLSDGVISVEVDEDTGERTLTADPVRILPKITDEATHVLVTHEDQPVWAKKIFVPDLEGATSGQAVVLDDEGNVVWSDIDGLPDASEAEAGDALILDAEGKPIWGKFEGLPDTEGAEAGMALALDAGLKPVWRFVDGLPDASEAVAGQVVALNSEGKAEWKTVRGLPEGEEGLVLTSTGAGAKWSDYHLPKRITKDFDFPTIVVNGHGSIAVEIESNSIIALEIKLNAPDLLLEIHQSSEMDDTNPYLFRSSMVSLEDDGVTRSPEAEGEGDEGSITVKETYSRRFAIFSSKERDNKIYMRIHNEGMVSVDPVLTLTYVPVED